MKCDQCGAETRVRHLLAVPRVASDPRDNLHAVPGSGARTVGLQPMQRRPASAKATEENRRLGRLPDLRLERRPLPLRRHLTIQRPGSKRMTIVRKTGALDVAGSDTVASRRRSCRRR